MRTRSKEPWTYEKALAASRAWKAAHRENGNSYNRRVRQREAPTHSARIQDWRNIFDALPSDEARCVAAHTLSVFADAGDPTAYKIARDPDFDYSYLAHHLERN